MLKNKKLSTAIAAAMSVSLAPAANAALEEIIVTATKRAESTQDIAVAVQALGEDSLNELRVGSFVDYINYLPNVNFGGRGPGQSSLYIRGVSTEQPNSQSSEAVGNAPLVALYLDEAPVTATGRNLDIYVSDVSRVEVLAGPQGTLFGASSMAGTIRLITNKPVFDEISAGVDLSTSFTQGGDPSTGVEGYFNLPLIDDKLALRLSMYSINEGGYIDNIFGTAQLPLDNPRIDESIDFYGPGSEPSAREVADNRQFVEENFNDASYQGGRIGLKYAINEDWEALLQVMNQTLKAEGVFDQQDDLGDLQAQRFYNESLEDTFTHTSWTVDGRAGTLDIIYTGSYLDREVDQFIDYSAYTNVSGFLVNYICTTIIPRGATTEPDGSPTPGLYDRCESPLSGHDAAVQQTRQTHEARISYDEGGLISFTAGLYYDDNEFNNQGNWFSEGSVALGNPGQAPLPNTTAVDPTVRDPGTYFFNDITRTEEQFAVFGEIGFQLTEQFNLALGARYYDIDLAYLGSTNFGGAGIPTGNDLDARLDPTSESGNVIKGTLEYTPNDDLLFYVTYSEGFRPGGFNRNGGGGGGLIPDTFGTDDIENIEFGWKTSIGDNLQFNGAIYSIDWSGIQVAAFDPNVSTLAFTFNAGEAEIRGIEGDVIYQVTDNFRIDAAFSFNDAELTGIVGGAAANTQLIGVGIPLAQAPEVQANARGRYEYSIGGRDAYSQLAVVYRDDANSSILANQNFDVDSYVTADFATGLQADDWNVELFIENLTDERAELFRSTVDFSRSSTVINRPRTVGVRVGFDF